MIARIIERRVSRLDVRIQFRDGSGERSHAVDHSPGSAWSQPAQTPDCRDRTGLWPAALPLTPEAMRWSPRRYVRDVPGTFGCAVHRKSDVRSCRFFDPVSVGRFKANRRDSQGWSPVQPFSALPSRATFGRCFDGRPIARGRVRSSVKAGFRLPRDGSRPGRERCSIP